MRISIARNGVVCVRTPRLLEDAESQSLSRLFEAGNISLEDALASSDNPDGLKMKMRGITKGGSTGR